MSGQQSRPAALVRPHRAVRRDAVRNYHRILDAARDVLGESGAGASMEEIAARAGVGVGTVYRRFASKDALIDELLRLALGEVAAVTERALARTDGYGLDELLRGVGQSLADHARYADLLLQRPTDPAASSRMRAAIDELTARARAAGTVHHGVTAGDIMALIWAMRGLIQTAGEAAPTPWERFLDIHLAGLRAAVPRPAAAPPPSRARPPRRAPHPPRRAPHPPRRAPRPDAGQMQPISPADERAVIAARLAGFQRVPIDAPGLRTAAVAVAVVIRRRVLCLLITKRAATMRRHPGQWALPGGSRDPGESAPDAARRELGEETGLVVPPGDVLGLLDDYRTRSGYLITPVVVWGGPLNTALRGPAAEVAQIHVIPLADLDRPPQLLRIPESERPVLRLPLLSGFVYAPTAAVIYQFCQLARHGLTTRVAHFDQPVFAWR